MARIYQGTFRAENSWGSVVTGTITFDVQSPVALTSVYGLMNTSTNDLSQVAAFSSFFGRPAAIQQTYFNQSSWTAFQASISYVADLFSGMTCMWNVPLAAQHGTLPDVVAGTHDAKFQACAEAILAAAPAGEEIWYSTGWEFNLMSQEQRAFDAAVPPNPTPAVWVSAFRRVVGIFRAVSPRFRVLWCPNIGDATADGLTVTDCYPGDEWVEGIGLDLYFISLYDGTGSGADVFSYRKTQGTGLDWMCSFAAAHGKPAILKEWGVNANTATGYMAAQCAYIRDPANGITIHGYWDREDGGVDSKISDGSLPAIGAIYRQYFGAPVVTNDLTTDSGQDADFEVALTSNQDGIDGIAITWEVVSGPATVDGNVLTITGAPAGAVSVTVRAINSDRTPSASVTLTHSFTAAHSFVNSEAQAYSARITATPTESRKALLDAFWTSMKAGPISGSNLLAKQDTFGFGFIDAQAATLNAKSAAYGTVIPVNNPVYIAGQGFQGDYHASTPRSLNMGIAFNRSGNVFTQNSAMLMAFAFSDISDNAPIIGNASAGPRLVPRAQNSSATGRATGWGSGATAAVATSKGFTLVNRSSASAEQLDRNGVQIAATTTGDASAGLTAHNLLGFGESAAYPGPHILGAWAMGSSLTASERKDIYNAFRNLMVGWGVISSADYPIAS